MIIHIAKNLITFTLILIGLISVIATSKKPTGHSSHIADELEESDKKIDAKVTSNCDDRQFNDKEIEIQNQKVFKPTDLTFEDFGLPTQKLDGDNSLEGKVNGVKRYCDPVFGGKNDNVWEYRCSEHGNEVCKVKIIFNN